MYFSSSEIYCSVALKAWSHYLFKLAEICAPIHIPYSCVFDRQLFLYVKKKERKKTITSTFVMKKMFF